ncbi:hypothetical protein [Streptomyces sp. NPDC058155]|uniref:hypothetical protein n=1 Tax=Streptomyces sp. NPDC058155 TaxID=3346359 RepID=UPI0036EF1B1E
MSTTPEPIRPCRTTQHCAHWGWCHRCAPALAKAARHVVKAISAAGIPVADSSAPYGQMTTVLAAASGVQPDTRPVPLCDLMFENGSQCAKPAGHRPFGSDDPHVPARPVPDAERRSRYAAALAKAAGSKAFMKTGTEWDHARGAWGLHADAALAVADEEQRDLRDRLRVSGEVVTLFRTELLDLRAGLEQARATTLLEAADFVRGLLLTQPGITTAGLEAALRRMAAEAPTGQAEDGARQK